ncbi:MAG: hypothetical protein ACYTFZ_10590, partial [Planctomycetota bacterium]
APFRRMASVFAKAALSAAVMALACWATLRALPAVPAAGALGVKTLRLLLPMAAGGMAFLAVAAALRTEELRAVLQWIGRTQKAG